MIRKPRPSNSCRWKSTACIIVIDTLGSFLNLWKYWKCSRVTFNITSFIQFINDRFRKPEPLLWSSMLRKVSSKHLVSNWFMHSVRCATALDKSLAAIIASNDIFSFSQHEFYWTKRLSKQSSGCNKSSAFLLVGFNRKIWDNLWRFREASYNACKYSPNFITCVICFFIAQETDD